MLYDADLTRRVEEAESVAAETLARLEAGGPRDPAILESMYEAREGARLALAACNDAGTRLRGGDEASFEQLQEIAAEEMRAALTAGNFNYQLDPELRARLERARRAAASVPLAERALKAMESIDAALTMVELANGKYVRIMDFAAELRQAVRGMRERAGLTQTDLAKATKTSQAWISQVEGGQRNPSIELLKDTAWACGFVLEVGLVPRDHPREAIRFLIDVGRDIDVWQRRLLQTTIRDPLPTSVVDDLTSLRERMPEGKGTSPFAPNF